MGMTERQVFAVSVVIAAHNSESSITRCVNSVLEDGHPRLELIVVDDGSSDGTVAIVKDLVLKHPGKIRLIEQENRGACNARNRGMRLATGDFIQFLDSDDELINGKIRSSMELFDKDSLLQCVYTDMLVAIDGVDTRVVSADHSAISALADHRPTSFTCGLNTNMALWSRRFVVDTGLTWNETLPCWHESVYYVELLSSMQSSRNIGHVEGPFIRFNRDSNHAGISAGYWSARYILGQLAALNLLRDRFASPGLDASQLSLQYSSFSRSLLTRAIVGNAKSAWSPVAAIVVQGGSPWYWRCLAQLPFQLVRQCYVFYRAVRRFTGSSRGQKS